MTAARRGMTMEELRARLQAARLEIDEARLEMVRGMLEAALAPVWTADPRVTEASEPAVSFDASCAPADSADGNG